jgi:hypothetical protein
MKGDDELLIMVADQYRSLWLVLEDLETLLWRIKELNSDLGGRRNSED